MFEKILIANRSEVAARVARTCKRLGVTTVAMHTDADADAVHVQACDEAVRLSATDLASSYLSVAAIVAAAKQCGADAVHPGYGLAAHDVALARAVAAAGLTFIGPSPEVIEIAADRTRVRALCEQVDVRVVGGTRDSVDTLRAAYEATEALGYPVVAKPLVPCDALGVRFADDDDEIEEAFEGARTVGRESAGDSRVVIERAIERPRVVEIEVLADAGPPGEMVAAEAVVAEVVAPEGESAVEPLDAPEPESAVEEAPTGISAAAETAARAAAERGAAEIVAIGDRECSAQRKLRRIVSESPAAALNGLANGDFVREALNEAAVRLVRAARVVGSATVRFLLDSDGRYHAIGLSVGLSVDHALHEMCTGLDLVEMQIRIAAGEPMPPEVLAASATGHAMEAHLMWDVQGAAPEGLLSELRFPPVGAGKARIETGLAQGSTVVPGYDALVAKITAFGPTRHQAALALDRVVAETVVAPFGTNAALVRRVLGHEAFRAGQYDTTFVERMIQQRI
jgi:acetyl/propionyl-CoA carboxylase alpha subunit